MQHVNVDNFRLLASISALIIEIPTHAITMTARQRLRKV